MNDKTYDAIYELLYDLADEVIKEQVLDPIREHGLDPDIIDVTESVTELRDHIRGYAINQIESLLERGLDSHEGKYLIDSINEDAKYVYMEKEVGELFWDVSIRSKGNHRELEGFLAYGTLDSVCSMMDTNLLGLDKLADRDWSKLEAIISVEGTRVAVMPNLTGPDYEIVCDIDVTKRLED